MALSVHYQNNKFRLRKSKAIRSWLSRIVIDRGFRPGPVSFIFTDDEYLREINRTFLEHDYFTDVITFNLSEIKGVMEGEIYISFETVKENSLKYKTGYYQEIRRVMVHGILHLAGLNDTDQDEKREMRRMEDYYLEKFEET